MANIKYAILNDIDVNGPDPYKGISMVLCDTPDEAIRQRVERLVNEDPEYDNSRESYVQEGEDLICGDGCIIMKLHAYYHIIGKDREVHSVFTAWPVYVD